jgi:hypothetical protein
MRSPFTMHKREISEWQTQENHRLLTTNAFGGDDSSGKGIALSGSQSKWMYLIIWVLGLFCNRAWWRNVLS